MKSLNIRKNLKKILGSILFCILIVSVVFVEFAVPVQAYTTTNVGSNKAYADGYFYVSIVDAGGVSSRVKISFSRNKTPDYDALLNGESRTWNMSLSTPSGYSNNHNIQLTATTMTSRLGSSNNATIASIKLKYTQHKYYRYKNYSAEKPGGGRFGPENVAANNGIGNNTIPTECVDADTVRTITVSVYLGNCGLVTANQKRYQGTVLTINYAKPQYTVNFYKEDNVTKLSTQTVNRGDNATKPSNNPTKTGYTFSKWDKAYTTVLSNLDIYPVFTANTYTVTYDSNGGSGTMSADTVSYNSDYTTKANSFTKNGYKFAGWNEKSDGTGISWTNYIGQKWKWTYTKNVTLYAQWTANTYTYTFVYGNGNENTTQTKTYGTALTLPSAPTKTGYEFTGWKSGTTDTVYTAGGSCTEEGDRTFTAQWRSTVYKITYDGNGAEKGSMDTVNVNANTDYKLDLCKYGRAGYTFRGWSLSKTATSATYEDEATVKDLTTVGGATVTLYAVWEIDASPEINMFTGCFKVSGQAGTTYNKNYVNHKRANIDSTSDPGYFTKQ